MLWGHISVLRGSKRHVQIQHEHHLVDEFGPQSKSYDLILQAIYRKWSLNGLTLLHTLKANSHDLCKNQQYEAHKLIYLQDQRPS